MSPRTEPPAKPPRGSLEWLGNAALFERLRAEQLTRAYAAEDQGDAAGGRHADDAYRAGYRAGKVAGRVDRDVEAGVLVACEKCGALAPAETAARSWLHCGE